MRRKHLGILTLIIASVFLWQETKYFGGHLFPTTWMMFVCDMVVIYLSILGFFILDDKNFNNDNSIDKDLIKR